MPKWKRWLVLFALTLLVVPPFIFAGWAWATLKYVYERRRAGRICAENLQERLVL